MAKLNKDAGREWYVVQTYSGYENKVCANLEQRIATMGMEDRIFRVLVPMEERVYNKEGKIKRVMRKIFPSYVLVEMVLEEQSWYVVRHTPGVTGFVGSGNHPLPLSPKEVSEIMAKLATEQSKPKVETGFAVGDTIRVKSGAFAGQVGPVLEVSEDKGRVKFSVPVFGGMETVVDADYTDLEKV
ncbi:transcription termination/antitermination protein NusG [Synergistales bacterium]|nr:transcription termination/antitermination protein NusG [Synergistales bacterium]GHV54172.1 transcription termination/antitermination protein NusG [Synergistales bacterium]